MKINTRKLATMGILSALSVLLVAFFHFPIVPGVTFLEFDPADIPILIGTFALGPVAGLVMTVVTALVQGLTVSAQSGPYGILMHIISTGTYVLVAGLIYRAKKTRLWAGLALIIGTVVSAGVMVVANLIVTPIFTGMPLDAVKGMILPAILPFNLGKAGINGLVTFFIYKRISNLIQGRKTVKKPAGPAA